MRSSAISAFAAAVSAGLSMNMPRSNCARCASVVFSRTVMPSTSPCALRSSVMSAIPAAIALRGERTTTRLPSTAISPLVGTSAPAIARTISVRPAPTRPASPTISPACTRNATSFTRTPLAELTPRTSSTTGASAATAGSSGKWFSKARPTIKRIRSSGGICAIGRVSTALPSRSTVTRSAMRGSSSSRCEM